MLISYNINTLIGFLLSYRKHEKLIFQHINFSLKKSTTLLLQGKNGSGKSTLIYLISGLLTKYKNFGNIIWNNKLILGRALAELYTTRINYINNKNAIKKQLTVKENLFYWGKLYNSYNYINDILIRLKLQKLKNIPVTMLSLGQTRRLLLAKLLIINSPLWLLDEPTIGLDLNSIKVLETLIAEHQNDGGLIIIASHNNLKFKKNLISLKF